MPEHTEQTAVLPSEPSYGLSAQNQLKLPETSPAATNVSVSSPFDSLKQSIGSEISKCEEAAKQTIDGLLKRISTLSKDAAHVEGLAAENKQLHNELDFLRTENARLRDELGGRSWNSTSSENVRLKEECERLGKQVGLELRARSNLYGAYKKVLARRQADQQSLKSWRSWYQKLHDTSRLARVENGQVKAFLDEISAWNVPSEDEPTTGSDLTTRNAATITDPSYETKGVQSSQSTEAEVEIVDSQTDIMEKLGESGSDPIVVSVRRVKRPCASANNQKNALVKQESGSSPISSRDLAALFPSENHDLDEGISHISTPRKRRRLAIAAVIRDVDQSQEVQDLGNKSQKRSTSLPLGLTTSNTENSEEMKKASSNCKGTVLASSSKPESNSELHDEAAEDTQFKNQGLREAEPILKQEATPRKPPLQHISTNRRILPPAKKHITNVPERHGAKFDELLWKNGESISRYLATSANKDQKTTKTAALDPAGSKLRGLLDTPLAPKQQLTPPSTVIKSLKATSGSPARITSVPHKSKHRKYAESGTRGGNEPAAPRPDEEPLRALPLKQQRLDNFKINPKSNNGYTFAYNEVVRNRAQRRCMPGCTRPECCGNQFRKMVELGGLPTPARTLWDSSQDVKDADQRLLEEYLGESEAWRLATMTSAEKHDLLISAKASTLANQHGRHRAYYPRSSTPPGFWRTDMPTTQEIETDRALGLLQTRERVAERYREALKPDGRWMFRDE